MRKFLKFDVNIENFKKRRALSGVSLNSDLRSFFDRIVDVKKSKEFVFVPKAKAKHRQ